MESGQSRLYLELPEPALWPAIGTLAHLLDQTLANQYLQRTLRQQQEKIVVSEAEVRAHYDAHAADYTVPARRRVAMLQIKVPEGAGEDVWKNATERAQAALAKARPDRAAKVFTRAISGTRTETN